MTQSLINSVHFVSTDNIVISGMFSSQYKDVLHTVHTIIAITLH